MATGRRAWIARTASPPLTRTGERGIAADRGKDREAARGLTRNERERGLRIEERHDPPQHLGQLVLEPGPRERGVRDALQLLEPRRRDFRIRSRGALSIEQLAAFPVGASQLVGVARLTDEGGTLAAERADLADHRRHHERGEAVEGYDEREVGKPDRQSQRIFPPQGESKELERCDQGGEAGADIAEPERGADDEEDREQRVEQPVRVWRDRKHSEKDDDAVADEDDLGDAYLVSRGARALR
jgi:hypothetical protein